MSERIVLGMSYAFGEYSDEVVNCLDQMGIKYARTVKSNNQFSIPSDFLRWKPTCHHNNDVINKAKKFLNTQGYQKLPLFYIWGHSYEFERENTWDMMEELCKTLSGGENIWYTTNIDYYTYVSAMKNIIFSADRSYVHNPSGIPVWFKADDTIIKVQLGETRKTGV